MKRRHVLTKVKTKGETETLNLFLLYIQDPKYNFGFGLGNNYEPFIPNYRERYHSKHDKNMT